MGVNDYVFSKNDTGVDYCMRMENDIGSQPAPGPHNRKRPDTGIRPDRGIRSDRRSGMDALLRDLRLVKELQSAGKRQVRVRTPQAGQGNFGHLLAKNYGGRTGILDVFDVFSI
jgi:hypothetical protein